MDGPRRSTRIRKTILPSEVTIESPPASPAKPVRKRKSTPKSDANYVPKNEDDSKPTPKKKSKAPPKVVRKRKSPPEYESNDASENDSSPPPKSKSKPLPKAVTKKRTPKIDQTNYRMFSPESTQEPSESLAQTLTSTTDPPTNTISAPTSRRPDILIAADNLGVEQRALILPERNQGASDFSDDDSDGFVDGERIDIAAQRQEILVVDRVQKRRIDNEIKERIRYTLQRFRHKNDNLHKFHVFTIVANLTKKMAICTAFARKQASNFPLADDRYDNVKAYLESLKIKSSIKMKKKELTLDFFDPQHMNNMFSLLCNDDLDMAFAVAMNLYGAGFVVRVVCGFKALPKGETNVNISEEMMEIFTKNSFKFPPNFQIKGKRTAAAEKKLKIGVPAKGKKQPQSRRKKAKIESETENEEVTEMTPSESSDFEDFENEEEFATIKKKPRVSTTKKKNLKSKTPSKATTKKAATPIENSPSPELENSFEKAKEVKICYFVEVWDEKRGMWICLDPSTGNVGKPNLITSKLDKRIDYVFAFDSDRGFRDVSIKYIQGFTSPERRQSRINENYIFNLMQIPFIQSNIYRRVLEDDLIRGTLMSMEMPKNKGAYRNNYFYTLQEHLKVKEILYPGSTAGNHNIFDVYYRTHVALVEIELRWIRKGFRVKEGEKPVKLLKKHSWAKNPEEPYNLFAPWQLQRYETPELIDGEIPKNEHDNIYGYQPWMIPKDCFHLTVQGHGEQIAILAEVEYVAVVVGWVFRRAKSLPVIYGVVVKNADLPVIMEAKKKYFDEKMDKKMKRYKRFTSPYVRKEQLRQEFITHFFSSNKLPHEFDFSYALK